MQFNLFLLKYQVLNLKLLFSILSTGYLTVISKNVKLVLKIHFEKMTNFVFHYNMISLANKPTWVTRHSANVIGHIITNSVTGYKAFKSAIIKTDFSDHFPIFLALKTNETIQKPAVKSTSKRSYHEKNLDKFENILQNRNWDHTEKIGDTSKTFKYFLDIFIDIYDKPSPKTEVKVQLMSDLYRYCKVIKKDRNRTPKNEESYKTYKNLFETIKKTKTKEV